MSVTREELQEWCIAKIDEEQEHILELGEGIMAGDEEANAAVSEHIRQIIQCKTLLKALRPTWRVKKEVTPESSHADQENE